MRVMGESEQSEDGPEAIIRAVWQVMAEQGLAAVSMRTVATAAAVSVGRIQYRYRTKGELLRVSLEAMLTGAARIHQDAADQAGDRDTLWHLLAHSISRSEQSDVGVSIFHQYVAAAVNHPDLARLLADSKIGQEREVARLLVQVAPDLGDPESAARSLVALSDGLAMRVLMGGVSAEEADRILSAALEAIVGPPT